MVLKEGDKSRALVASEQSRLSLYDPQGTGPRVHVPLVLSVLETLLDLAI